MEGTAAGQSSLVLVEGPPGIGKTKLLRAAQARAAELGLLVLGARAGEIDRSVPHGVARDLLERTITGPDDELLAGAAALATAAIGPRPAEALPADLTEFAVTHGLYWLVCNLADRRPLVMIVDDAHRADAPSLHTRGHRC